VDRKFSLLTQLPSEFENGGAFLERLSIRSNLLCTLHTGRQLAVNVRSDKSAGKLELCGECFFGEILCTTTFTKLACTKMTTTIVRIGSIVFITNGISDALYEKIRGRVVKLASTSSGAAVTRCHAPGNDSTSTTKLSSRHDIGRHAGVAGCW
jgi:hypothetical protein